MADHDASSTSSPLPPPPKAIQTLHNINLPSSKEPHDIHISNTGHITSITPSTTNPSSSSPSPYTSLLALPSLCHPHIHLDKAYLLSHPLTAHLTPTSGTFSEALSLTSEAKTHYTPASLRARMDQLIAASIAHGVTHMRAFCEVDATVGHMCVRAGLEAKARWAQQVAVQVCAFAQDPVFSGERAAENRGLMEDAVAWDGVEVLGATPYVEDGVDRERDCVRWAVRLAMQKGVMLDLHLDYHLQRGRESRVFDVLRELREVGWGNGGGTVCLGHCTRLTLFEEDEWEKLRKEVEGLPVYFVGLPTSDLFMMGRPGEGEELYDRKRTTLQVPAMIGKGFRCALGVNNVGNAFTPYGSGDPLEVAKWGIGLYQVGTADGAQLLFDCVSSRAKEAIGITERKGNRSGIEVGDKADLLLIGKSLEKQGPFYRKRTTTQEAVWDAGPDRMTLFEGRLTDNHQG